MEPRAQQLKEAFAHRGAGFNFPVYRGLDRYQAGAGIGDVLRGIWRFFRPVAVKGAQALFKAGSESLKDNVSLKDVMKSTLKPAIKAVIGATAEQVNNRLPDERSSAAPPPGSTLESTMPPVVTQNGSGKKRRSRSLYKKPKRHSKSARYSSRHRSLYKRPTLNPTPVRISNF